MQLPELKNIQPSQSSSGAERAGNEVINRESIRLDFPLVADGMTIESVMMRRPLVRDRLAAEKSSGSEVEKEIRLIANLCEMAPQHIELLDLADYVKLQECLANFLS